MGDVTDDLLALAGRISRRAARARDGHAARHRRAGHDRAARDGDPLARPRGDLAHRAAGRHRLRHDAHEGADPGGARGPRARRARRGPHRHRRRLPGHHATRARSPRSAAAAPTRRRSPIAAGIGADVCEIYTDVDGVYTADPRIVPARAQDRRDLATRRCSRWRRPARACCSCARWSSRATTAWSSTCAAASTTSPAPSSRRPTPAWSRRSSRVSRTTPRRRRSRSATSRTGPASPPTVFGKLAEHNVNVDMIIQNVSEDGTTDISLHRRPRRTSSRAKRAVEEVVARARRARLVGGRVDREGLARRRGHEDASRRRRPDVPRARRRGREPRHDLDRVDPHQLRDRRRRRREGRARAARRTSAWTRGAVTAEVSPGVRQEGE